MSFSTFIKNELKQLGTKGKDIDYKKLLQEIYFGGFSFLKKYGTPYVFLKNLVANKISISAVNDEQRDFVFDLMRGYNVSSLFQKKRETKDFDNRLLYEKSLKHLKFFENLKKVLMDKNVSPKKI